MTSANGRYVITYNGEVYNFRELRTELETLGHRFQGSSDTEVMLASFVQWGPENAVKRFLGMFAFALFDRQTRTLRLVRDRLGVKPLYWTIVDNVLLFGSELRALMVHPSFRMDINRDAIAAFVGYSYIPAPATIFNNVFKLPPGSTLTLRSGQKPTITAYWRLLDHLSARVEEPMDFAEASDRVHDLLLDAVRRRMISDVPIGAFLSGGTDSSTVVALMQSASTQPVRTFTVGFSDNAYDESMHAAAVARHLGTDHTEFKLDVKTALGFVDQIADWFDEPFADSSQLPTYLVSRMTRQHVTVALSGDGGDELFAGYPKYQMLSQIWNVAGPLPRLLRWPLGKALSAIPERLANKVGAALLDAGRAERIGEKLRRLGDALAAATADDAALAVARVGLRPDGLVRDSTDRAGLDAIPGLDTALPDFTSRMQIYDTLNYLPDDIMTKVDRCSMAVSLEAREPLLDHRLVELVWSFPQSIRQHGKPKALLRSVLARYLPESLMDTPKRGFSIPLAQWLAGPLRPWAEDLLSPERLNRQSFFDTSRVRHLWDMQMNGTVNNATGLWNILMMSAWSQRWRAR
jgi:asparagine synthase (glutamine-hydrolysing)